MENDNWAEAGNGLATWTGPAVAGTVTDVQGPEDVLELIENELDDVIVLIHTAGASMLAPVFADLCGIVCTAGNVGAHVAILAREYGVPCIVAATLADEELDGRQVRLEPSGSVLVAAS